jgi:hypothetical protein
MTILLRDLDLNPWTISLSVVVIAAMSGASQRIDIESNPEFVSDYFVPFPPWTSLPVKMS